jgi:hypothetical protein
MNKTKKYLIVWAMMLTFTPVIAQNTASVSGNWDTCSTWGNPTIGITKGNDAASAKTINSSTTVAMNTNWNSQSVNFSSATSILDFNSTANILDLNLAGGTPKSCILPCPTPSSLAVSGAGNIGSCVTRSFVLTGNNISNATWAVTPTIGASPTSGSGTTANINFNSSASGNYTVTYTANSTGGTCTTTTATKNAVVNVSPTADANFTASGSSSNSVQTNAQHAGESNCFVTIGSGGFTYNVTGSYTLTGTIVISSAGGSNHEVRHNRYGTVATNVGSTPFSITISRNAGDYDNYFWMYTAGGGFVQFTISDGKVHKN